MAGNEPAPQDGALPNPWAASAGGAVRDVATVNDGTSTTTASVFAQAWPAACQELVVQNAPRWGAAMSSGNTNRRTLPDPRVLLRVVNRTRAPLLVSWLGYDGSEPRANQFVVHAGRDTVQETYVNHAFVARLADTIVAGYKITAKDLGDDVGHHVWVVSQQDPGPLPRACTENFPEDRRAPPDPLPQGGRPRPPPPSGRYARRGPWG